MSANPPIVEIGSIQKLANPFQQYVIAIQSFRQFVSIALWFAFAMIAFFGFFKLAFGNAPPMIVLVFGFIGVLPVLAATLPTRFIIDVENSFRREEVVSFLRGKAFRFGYKAEIRIDGKLVLSPKWPRVLVWDENKVTIEECGIRVVVTSPAMTTAMLHAAASKAFRSTSGGQKT